MGRSEIWSLVRFLEKLNIEYNFVADGIIQRGLLYIKLPMLGFEPKPYSADWIILFVQEILAISQN